MRKKEGRGKSRGKCVLLPSFPPPLPLCPSSSLLPFYIHTASILRRYQLALWRRTTASPSSPSLSPLRAPTRRQRRVPSPCRAPPPRPLPPPRPATWLGQGCGRRHRSSRGRSGTTWPWPTGIPPPRRGSSRSGRTPSSSSKVTTSRSRGPSRSRRPSRCHRSNRKCLQPSPSRWPRR